MRINRRIAQLTKNIDVDVEVELDSEDICRLTDECDSEAEKILIKKALKGKTFTKYVEDFKAEIYFDIDDILELVDSCNDYEKGQIIDITYNEDMIKCETLYDEQKMKVLKSAFDKFDLDELEKRLK